MPPPPRTSDDDYHFHVYDYLNSQPWTLSRRLPQRDQLRFYSMVQDLQGLLQTGQNNNVPNITLANVGAGIAADGTNYDMQVLSFGGPNVLGNTPEIVITGGIHAREWAAVSMAYLLAEYLIVHYPPNNNQLTRYQRLIRLIVDRRRIHIIPMVNPAGNKRTVFTAGDAGRLWRRNRRVLPRDGAGWQAALLDPALQPHPPFRNVQLALGVTSYKAPRFAAIPLVYDSFNLPNENPLGQPPVARANGVDLNRNFPTPGFGYNGGPGYTNAVPDTDGYFGTEAASELETQNLQQFIAGLQNLQTSIDYHSHGKAILYPSELQNAGVVNPNYQNLGQIMQRLISPSWNWPWSYDYRLGSPRELLGYDATGTLADHIGQQHNSRSFVIELDSGPGSGRGAGFKLREDQIRTVFEKNLRGALALIMAAGRQSTFATTTAYCCFQRRTISSTERQLLDWDVIGRGNQLPA